MSEERSVRTRIAEGECPAQPGRRPTIRLDRGRKGRERTRIIAWFAAVLGAATGAGCDSSAASVCDAICECEHCNDYQEDLGCRQVEWQAEVAEVYGCASEFEDWAACVEESGTCNERDASYTTLESGSCSAKGSRQLDCSLDENVCTAFGPGTFCEDGDCKYTGCKGDFGPTPPQCERDEDCPTGADRCADPVKALQECEAAASEVNPYLQQPPPPPSEDGASGGAS